MSYLLNACYLLFLLILWPVILYRMIRYGKYRQGIGQRFFGCAPQLPPKGAGEVRVWFQAVSVGEVNLLKPILNRMAAVRPEWEPVISATSKTGYELARKLFPNRTVFRCPLDFSWSVRRAVRRIQPDMLVLVELELWPNLIFAAKAHGVATAIVNGRISDRSVGRYLMIRPLIRRVLRAVDLVAVCDGISAESFRRLGVEESRLTVTGSIKFDGVATDRRQPKTVELANLAGILPSDIVFLAGSTQEPEERLAVEAFRELSPRFPNLRLILVPRHTERFDTVAAELDTCGLPWLRRTRLESATAAEKSARILLVDTIGELGAWWGTARIAFVGGSMGKRGGQNMLEPAGFGAAVSFGPNTRNFQDISSMMIRSEAATVVADGAEMTAFVRRCLEDPSYTERLGRRAQELVLGQLGAVDITVERLEKIL